jgi:hypothetical protein
MTGSLHHERLDTGLDETRSTVVRVPYAPQISRVASSAPSTNARSLAQAILGST